MRSYWQQSKSIFITNISNGADCNLRNEVIGVEIESDFIQQDVKIKDNGLSKERIVFAVMFKLV